MPAIDAATLMPMSPRRHAASFMPCRYAFAASHYAMLLIRRYAAIRYYAAAGYRRRDAFADYYVVTLSPYAFSLMLLPLLISPCFRFSATLRYC